jgi:adenylate cyclase, class 2
MQAAEIELKFPVDDPFALQQTLPELGFHLDTPRTLEQNTLYDTAGRELRAKRQLLRVRQYGAGWTVTHKRQPEMNEAEENLRYKVRIETETRIEDGEAMAEIFTRLGYAAVFRYEKYRSEWSQPVGVSEGSGLVSGHLVVDETPIGNYAELEGPTDWIERTLAQLGVDPGRCLTESYGKLFLEWKERTGSPAENLTFAEVGSGVLAG